MYGNTVKTVDEPICVFSILYTYRGGGRRAAASPGRKGNQMKNLNRKVTVVGAGPVGSTFAYSLAQAGLADEIAICDAFTTLAIGQVMDLVQGSPYLPRISIHVGTDEDFKDSDIVVICAGSKDLGRSANTQAAKDGFTLKNAEIVSGIARRVAASGCPGVMVVVTNPVDLLTGVAVSASGWPRNRVIGSGTILDTARFRYTLSRECHIDARNVHGYILGEHGNGEIAAWSMTFAGGQPIDEFAKPGSGCGRRVVGNRDDILREVRESTNHVMNYKGSACYAIGLALTRLTGAILRDEQSIMTVSVKLCGEYGINDVCLSVPSQVGRGGVSRIIEARLEDGELSALKAAAGRQKDALERLGLGGRRLPASK